MCFIKKGKKETARLVCSASLCMCVQLQALQVQADQMASLVLLLEALWRCRRDTGIDFLGQGAEERCPCHHGDSVGRKYQQVHGDTGDYYQISCETLGKEKVAQSWKVGDYNVWP